MHTSELGEQIMAWAAQLAVHSDMQEAFTRTYLTPAHHAAAAQLAAWMHEAGMTVRRDAVGNVIGRYQALQPDAPALLTGSHFDSVRNGGISHHPDETISVDDADLAARAFIDFVEHFSPSLSP